MRPGKPIWLLAAVFVCATVALAAEAPQSTAPEVVEINLRGPGTPLPHFWEQMFGSGRAILTLRDSYRTDLRKVKQATGFTYIRFHAIFHDEVGLYDEDGQGRPVYNFSYIDQIYDGLLQNGVRPFVELSFMPKKLAAKDAPHAFWYKPNVAPPKDWDRWGEMISAFARHLVERYGIDEVAKWYFEVWNEPNIDFWVGDPKQETYFHLYDVTARAIKSVSPRLRIGGPATAQAAWVDQFIQHCAQEKVPLDFVSTHVYGNDKSEDVFGTHEVIPRDKMVCRAVRKVHDQIKASAMPKLPLFWTEFNASYMNEPDVTDAPYMGPWMADTIRQCDGLVDVMSYWDFSDVFEEQGVVKQPFYGGFGLMAEEDIPKAAFNDFQLLHKLGNERLAVASEDVLATRRKDASFALALWNYAPPAESAPPKSFVLKFSGLKPNATIRAWRVDAAHGDPTPAYHRMGNPKSPTMAQIRELRRAAEMAPPQSLSLKQGEVTLQVPAHGLVLLEIK